MGVDADRYFRIVPLPDKIVAGIPRLNSEDIVIGTELAKDLGVTVGDKLRIVPSSGKGATLTVTGLVDLGSKGANQRNTYVALHTAQALLGLIGGVSSIDLTVRDIYAAEDRRAGDRRGDRHRGRQLDPDQQPALRRDQRADHRQQRDPAASSPSRSPSASPPC